MASHWRCLAAGIGVGESLSSLGLIRAAALNLRGETRVIGAASWSQLADSLMPDRSLVHA